MTDRYNSFIVILEKDTRDDDSEPIIMALKMIKGVLTVTPNVADMNSQMAELRAKQELSERLWEALHKPMKKD